MKPKSSLKKIVVKCGDFWMDEHEIDSEIFDDVYVEAATRAIERLRSGPGFKVTVIIETWEKKDFKRPEKHICYNTYRILINAGMHVKAETMRLNFLNAHGIDLSKENLKGNNDGNPEQPKQPKQRKSKPADEPTSADSGSLGN